MKDIGTVVAIDRNEMLGLATTEYARMVELLRTLDEEDWKRQTVCDDWSVRLMVAHLLGAAEGNASLFESIRQLRAGRKVARQNQVEDVDGINAVQVEARRHLSPVELIERLEVVAPRAAAGRKRIPGPVRKIRIATGVGYDMTMGHLVDRVYTRDQWLHRIDIAAATEHEPVLTSEHDGRIVEDVVLEWALAHGEAFELVLGGPAGGEYQSGRDGLRIEMDAVEFCLVLSGRLDKEMPLSRPIVF